MTYPDSFHQVYTDGSAFKGTSRAGCGARIEYSDKSCDELAEPCGLYCDNYKAEALALQHALVKMTETFERYPDKVADCVVFSDSQSVLKVLDEENYSTIAIRDLAINISNSI